MVFTVNSREYYRKKARASRAKVKMSWLLVKGGGRVFYLFKGLEAVWEGMSMIVPASISDAERFVSLSAKEQGVPLRVDSSASYYGLPP